LHWRYQLFSQKGKNMSDETFQDPSPTSGDEQPSRAVLLARLAVGAISYGLDLLDTQVPKLQTSTGDESGQRPTIEMVRAEGEVQPSNAIVLTEPISTESVKTQTVSIQAAQVQMPATVRPKPSQADIDRQNTLVGMLIAGARGFDQAAQRADRVSRLAGRIVEPIVTPVAGSPLLRPLRNSWDRWLERGQQEVDSWRQIGEEETARGQELLQNVTMSTVNASIDYITVQPEVTDLVTHQTSTLTYEVLTILREVLFNLDFILEGVLRRVLRMKPRREIPGPSREIRERGVTGFVQMHEKPNIDAPGSWAGYYAGIASRTASLAIDLTLLAVVLAFIAFFAQQVMDIMRIGLSLFIEVDLPAPSEDPVIMLLVSSTVSYGLFVLYHTIAWCITGATIGDAVAGLRVVTTGAELPKPWRAFLRVTVGYTLSFLLFGFGFLMVLWTPRRRGLHDNLFKTFKVYSWDARPSRRLLNRLATDNIPKEAEGPKPTA
jgi:uncharacterized RDD family membrane protein YckC